MSEIPEHAGGSAHVRARDANGSRRLDRMHGTSFGILIMLLAQYGLGMWVNLYGRLPRSDHGRGLLAAFGDAVAKGPVSLAIHAILRVILIIIAISLAVRAGLARHMFLTVTTAAGLVSIVTAVVNGHDSSAWEATATRWRWPCRREWRCWPAMSSSRWP
jgi:hypothetical protein